jgi:hypothetical protein
MAPIRRTASRGRPARRQDEDGSSPALILKSAVDYVHANCYLANDVGDR